MRRKDTKNVSPETKIDLPIDLTPRENLHWDDFRVFSAVAKAGSLRQAAIALGVKQPTIRRRLTSLEDALNVRLIDRDRRGFTLTYEGRGMVDIAEEIAVMINKAATQARNGGQETEGECKLAMSDGIATGWFIPHFLGAFTARYPKVVVRLAAAADADKIVLPPYDIQIRYAPAHDGDLMVSRLATFHLTYFASHSYIENFGLPRTHADLRNHRLADVTASHTSDTGLMAQYSNADALGRPYFYTNSGNIVFEVVAAGQCIGLLPTYTVLLAPDIVPVIPDFQMELGVFIYFTDAASKRPATRGMIEFLRDVVFDKTNMPWFSGEYIQPVESWHRTFSDLCYEARRGSKLLADR